MQEYNAIQRQIDDLTGTEAAQRHAEQRRLDFIQEYHTENRAQRRERERQERRARKKVPA